MDRKASKSSTAWAIAGGAAVGAVALYFAAQYYKKVLPEAESPPIDDTTHSPFLNIVHLRYTRCRDNW
jgi:hypothetical protein